MWFKSKHSVCSDCQVYFEPAHDGEPFRDFCSLHRAPKLAILARKRIVMRWAEANWEKLEPEALKENAENHAAAQQAAGIAAFAGLGLAGGNSYSRIFGSGGL